MQLAKFDQQCRDMLDESPSRHSRNCLRSALNHLEMAEKILELDPMMAAFRGLTAEEEAASGLMHCLKEKGYINSNYLKPKDHFHKNGISPFLDVLGRFFAENFQAHVKKPVFKLEGEGQNRRLMLGFQMEMLGAEKLVYPIPPLNFSVSINSKRFSYKSQIDFLADHHGAKSISDYIRDQANVRNKLLYAGPDGYPGHVELHVDFFKTRLTRVLALLRGYLLIQPYSERLTFVQDSQDAFLAMMGQLKDHDLHDGV